MELEISNELKEKLWFNELLQLYKIKYWKKNEETFNVHIFTVELKLHQRLKDIWEIVNSDIALEFQAQLEVNIERWNIYIVFLVKEKIDSIVKYEVEQNKYCSRKIVIDEFLYTNETEICSFIYSKLFDITMNDKPFNSNDKTNLSKIIENKNSVIHTVITANDFDAKSALIKLLGDDIYED